MPSKKRKLRIRYNDLTVTSLEYYPSEVIIAWLSNIIFIIPLLLDIPNHWDNYLTGIIIGYYLNE